MDGHAVRASGGETTPLLEAVREAIVRQRLAGPGDRVLVAVSGGPDSVALLDALVRLAPELRLVLAVCHVHHGLRPEADGDAQFVTRLGAQFGCVVGVERVTVRVGAGRSPEAAARAARYAALARAARAFSARRIALGHTADDQAETVLMRILQGAGPRGLAGIPVRRGRFVRPLLAVDRATVLAHLGAHGLPHVEDATNRDPAFLRNRIRHGVLPLLVREAGPRVPDALRRLAYASREAVAALDALLRPRLAAHLRPAPGGWGLDLRALDDLPPGGVKTILRLAVAKVAPADEVRAGLRVGHLDSLVRLLDAPIGARVRLPGGGLVERGRACLWIGRPGLAAAVTPVSVPGETPVPGVGLLVTADVVHPAPGHPADPAWEAWFDADLLPPDLVVRPRRPDERIVPFGSERSVRVSRLLAAAGAPRFGRAHWPILDGRAMRGERPVDDLPLWVIGVRRGRAAPITSDTRAMVRVRAMPVLVPASRQEDSP